MLEKEKEIEESLKKIKLKYPFVCVHLLRPYNLGNHNSDRQGQPKTAILGGVLRSMISSQCQGYTLRKDEQFCEDLCGLFPEMAKAITQSREHVANIWRELSVRPEYQDKTKRTILIKTLNILTCLIDGSYHKKPDVENNLKKLIKADDILSPKKGSKKTEDVEDEDASEGKRDKIKSVAEGLETIVTRLTDGEVASFKQMAIDISTKKTTDEKILKEVEEKFLEIENNFEAHILQILFGRFSAGYMRIFESAVKISPSIDTGASYLNTDDFTATDDLAKTSGSGHLGSRTITSGVHYAYMTIDLHTIIASLGLAPTDGSVMTKPPQIVMRLVGLIIKYYQYADSKSHSTQYNHVGLPLWMGVSFANRNNNRQIAFQKPIEGSMVEDSIKRLCSHVKNEYKRLGTKSGFCEKFASQVYDGIDESDLVGDVLEGDAFYDWIEGFYHD